MATDFELALFEQQLEEVLALPEACRWSLERDISVPLGVFAIMHPLSNPEELFKARLRWNDLMKAPSLKFIDMTTGGRTTRRRGRSASGFGLAAWTPACRGPRKGTVCTASGPIPPPTPSRRSRRRCSTHCSMSSHRWTTRFKEGDRDA